MKRVAGLRDRLEQGLLKHKIASVNGNREKRLPTVTNISFNQTAGKQLITGILKEIAVSSGSACSSALPEPSHVLKAMGLDDEQAFHAIRFSLGKYNTEEEIDFVIDRVGLALKETSRQSILHPADENL